jgi:tetratricopeptide (TPR) repeat protein
MSSSPSRTGLLLTTSTLKLSNRKAAIRSQSSSAIELHVICTCASKTVLQLKLDSTHLVRIRFRSAVQDAKEAIDLNPNYVKAWGRLGAAHVVLRLIASIYALRELIAQSQELQEHNKAIEAFERAIALIDALPNQTAADLKLKAQYEVAMGTEKHNFGGHHVIIQRDAMGNAPWDIAEEMKPGLVALGPEGLESSVSFRHFLCVILSSLRCLY